jgi:hypothetical protein
MAEHLPTPWKAVKVYGYSGYHNHDIRDAENDSIILDVDSEEGPGFGEADALLIVRAVNAHDRLVAALVNARAELYGERWDGTCQGTIDEIDAVLAEVGVPRDR